MSQLNTAQASGIPMDTLFSTASAANNATNTRNHINLRPNRQNTQQAMQSTTQQLVITHSKDWWSIVSEFLLIGGSLAALGYMFKTLISQQTNDAEQNRKAIAEHCKRVLLKKMKKSGRKISAFTTNTYEDSLLDLIVLPSSINVKFSDIGGLEHIKRDLTETVLVPLIYPQLTGSSRLCAPPLGVLFHGPPGTGKSMMAKAIARETNATFFNVDMSRLMSKWYGDSQKYISALFSLARKMAPSIIWIDEIDALFSQRSRSDHSADVYNKALFLSLWDGLANDIYKADKNRGGRGSELNGNQDTAQVIILGASNRPQQVDEAFLRRMSRQYEFVMPDEKTRRLILSILLKTERVHKNVNLSDIAQRTNFYSGSDLKELCKYAATLPLREYVRKRSSLRSQSPSKSKNYTENVILDGMSSATPDGSSSDSASSSNAPWFVFGKNGNTPKGPPIVSSMVDDRVNVMDIFENQKEGFKLRPIEQNDLMTALKHIKSTMKAHNDHKLKYGTANKNSLFNNLGLFGLSNHNNNINNNNVASSTNTSDNNRNDDNDREYDANDGLDVE